MKYPQIELWLYDTQHDLDQDALEGKVCPWSAVHALSPHCPAPLSPAKPWDSLPRPDYDFEARKAVFAANCQAGIPTQMPFALTKMAGLAGPLLLAATWQMMPVLFGSTELRCGDWSFQPMTLHYHGFSGQMEARHLPLFPPAFPRQPYPLHTLLWQALSSRRRPLYRRPRPFPIQEFLQDSDGLKPLQDWKLFSRLPDRGVFTGDRLWEAPLQYRYPTTWIIDRGLPFGGMTAYKDSLGQKHPNWPDLLCRAIQGLPPDGSRCMLVLDDFSRNPAETILGGHCLCFSVDDRNRSVTITRDDDAREDFCHALEEYNMKMNIPEDGFVF